MEKQEEHSFNLLSKQQRPRSCKNMALGNSSDHSATALPLRAIRRNSGGVKRPRTSAKQEDTALKILVDYRRQQANLTGHTSSLPIEVLVSSKAANTYNQRAKYNPKIKSLRPKETLEKENTCANRRGSFGSQLGALFGSSSHGENKSARRGSNGKDELSVSSEHSIQLPEVFGNSSMPTSTRRRSSSSQGSKQNNGAARRTSTGSQDSNQTDPSLPEKITFETLKVEISSREEDKIQFLLRNPDVVRAVNQALEDTRATRVVKRRTKREIMCHIPHDRFRLPKEIRMLQKHRGSLNSNSSASSHHSKQQQQQQQNRQQQLQSIEEASESPSLHSCRTSQHSRVSVSLLASKNSMLSSCGSFAGDSSESDEESECSTFAGSVTSSSVTTKTNVAAENVATILTTSIHGNDDDTTETETGAGHEESESETAYDTEVAVEDEQDETETETEAGADDYTEAGEESISLAPRDDESEEEYSEDEDDETNSMVSGYSSYIGPVEDSETNTEGEESVLTSNTEGSSEVGVKYGGLSVYLSTHSCANDPVCGGMKKSTDSYTATSVTEDVTSISQSNQSLSLGSSNQSSVRTSLTNRTARTNRTSNSAPGMLSTKERGSNSSLSSIKSELDESEHSTSRHPNFSYSSSRSSLRMEDLSKQTRASSAPLEVSRLSGAIPLLGGDASSVFGGESDCESSVVSGSDHRRRRSRSRSSSLLRSAMEPLQLRENKAIIPRSNTPQGMKRDSILRKESGHVSENRVLRTDVGPMLPPRTSSTGSESSQSRRSRRQRGVARAKSNMEASSRTNSSKTRRGAVRTKSGLCDSFMGGSRIKKWDNSTANRSGHGLSLLERHLTEGSAAAKQTRPKRRPSRAQADLSVASLQRMLNKESVQR